AAGWRLARTLLARTRCCHRSAARSTAWECLPAMSCGLFTASPLRAGQPSPPAVAGSLRPPLPNRPQNLRLVLLGNIIERLADDRGEGLFRHVPLHDGVEDANDVGRGKQPRELVLAELDAFRGPGGRLRRCSQLGAVALLPADGGDGGEARARCP